MGAARKKYIGIREAEKNLCALCAFAVRKYAFAVRKNKK